MLKLVWRGLEVSLYLTWRLTAPAVQKGLVVAIFPTWRLTAPAGPERGLEVELRAWRLLSQHTKQILFPSCQK